MLLKSPTLTHKSRSDVFFFFFHEPSIVSCKTINFRPMSDVFRLTIRLSNENGKRINCDIELVLRKQFEMNDALYRLFRNNTTCYLGLFSMRFLVKPLSCVHT